MKERGTNMLLQEKMKQNIFSYNEQTIILNTHIPQVIVKIRIVDIQFSWYLCVKIISLIGFTC